MLTICQLKGFIPKFILNSLSQIRNLPTSN